MKNKLFHLLILNIFLFSSAAYSMEVSPVGLWKAHDDQGKPTGFIRVTENAGMIIGKVERGLPEETQAQYCSACKDERKNQPLVGMVMMKGVKAKADYFEGEEILDPFSGNTYRVKLKLKDQGKKNGSTWFCGLKLIWQNASLGKS